MVKIGMKQNNILLTAFQGEENISKILVDQISNAYDKFIFSNDYTRISNEICNVLSKKTYDFIICFGQKPIIKRLSIETLAKQKNECMETNFPIKELCGRLDEKNISYKLIKNPGTSYCNFLYYNLLKYVEDNQYPTKIVFIHVPYLANFLELKKVAHLFDE